MWTEDEWIPPGKGRRWERMEAQFSLIETKIFFPGVRGHYGKMTKQRTTVQPCESCFAFQPPFYKCPFSGGRLLLFCFSIRNVAAPPPRVTKSLWLCYNSCRQFAAECYGLRSCAILFVSGADCNEGTLVVASKCADTKVSLQKYCTKCWWSPTGHLKKQTNNMSTTYAFIQCPQGGKMWRNVIRIIKKQARKNKCQIWPTKTQVYLFKWKLNLLFVSLDSYVLLFCIYDDFVFKHKLVGLQILCLKRLTCIKTLP